MARTRGIRRKKRMKFIKSSVFIKIVILALIVYATISLVSVNDRIAQAQADQEILQAKVDRALQVNAELEYDVAHADDEETIEEIAREKLGLVMPGEKIFYDIGN